MTVPRGRGTLRRYDLGGVTFSIIAQSKAVMASGGWVVGLVVDQGAGDAQVDAVTKIVSGQAGGPLAALAPLIAEISRRGAASHPV
jgi:hypothetical protein